MRFSSIALSGSTILLGITASCVPNPRISITEQTDLPDFHVKSMPTNNSKTVSIGQLASRVRQNNPQLRAAQLTIQEAKGRIVQSGRLENPSLGIGLSKVLPGSEGELEVSFSQRFPTTNKLALEKRVSQQALEIARKEIKVAELALVEASQLIAVEILSLGQRHQHISKQIQSLDAIAKFIEDAAQRGELSPLDASQTRLEIQALKAKQEQLNSEKEILTSQLKGYVGLSPDRPLTVTGSLPQVSLPSATLKLHNRPEYRAKLLEFKQSKSEILLEKSRRYEDVEMSVSGAIGREEDAGLATEGAVGFGVSIPLPLYDKNEGNIQAATAKAKRHMLEKSAVAKLIKTEAQTHKSQMQAWLKQNATIKKTMLPMARENSTKLHDIYCKGQGNFTDMLKAKSQELELQSQLIENALEFQKARVQYFSSIGKSQYAF